MKVLILANSDGGLFDFRKELLEELVKENEVILSVPGKGYVSYFNGIGCKVIPTQFNRRGMNLGEELKLYSRYRKILKEENPDIVLTYTIKPNVYGGMACASLGIPYVANITGLGSAVENDGIMQKITLFLYKIGLRKAKKVFFQNTANRDFLVGKGIIRGAYELLPGSGVNLDRFTVSEYPTNDTIDFFFIGRVMKEKGIEQYIDAAEYIRKKYPQTRFHVFGGSDQVYGERLKALQDQDVLIYHGRVSNMPEMQKMSCCTIHPTYYPEGLSNVLLESCASGRPIITTDRPGCREVVDEGVNGFVVKQKDSKDLIEKIEKFLALSWEQRRDMGLAGRAKVEREFSRKIVVDKYMKEIQRK